MELVYPIYLDREMMLGFLASLENGLVSFSDLERRSKESEEKQRSFSLGMRISNLFSSIFGAGGDIDLGKTKGKSAEEVYKGTVHYPDIALFIKLRDLMLEKKHLRLINEADELSKIKIGDIIELKGSALPNPAFQVRNLFKQIEPLIKAVYESINAGLEHTIMQVEGAKPGEVVKIQDEEVTVQNNKHRTALIRFIEITKKSKQSEEDSYQMMGKALSDLFPQDGSDTVAFDSKDFRAICRLYC